MQTHVKVVGWLWIINAVLSILMFLAGVGIVNWPGTVPDQQTRILVSVGSVCFFLPGVIAYLAAGIGLLKFKGWARILAIIVAIFNVLLFPIGTALAIYTLVIMFNKEAEALFKRESPAVSAGDVSA